MSAVSTPSASYSVERFSVDPEVGDLDRDLKKRERSPQQKYALIAIPAMFALAVASAAGMLFFTPDGSPQVLLFSAISGGVIITLVGVLGARVISLTNTSEKIKVNEARKESQQSIKRSVRTARTLGESVPVLTKAHVEAGIRFDQAIGAVWKKRDAEIIRELLLSDLSRENAILSLVSEHGMTNAAQVTAALQEIESRMLKPLQGGWL